MSVSRARPVYVQDGGGQELDYVEITSNVSVTGSEGAETVVVTGNPVTYDGQTTVLIEFFAPTLLPAASASAALRLYLFDGSTNLGRLGDTTTPSATAERVGPVVGKRRLTPSAGSHTYSIRAATTTGTGTVGAGAGGAAANFLAAFLRITRVSAVIGAAGVAGVAGGFAPLDSGLLVPRAYLPSRVQVTLGPYQINDLAASATTTMQLGFYNTSTAVSLASKELRMALGGRVIGMMLVSDALRTSGSAIGQVRIGGTPTTFAADTCVLDGTNTDRVSAFVSWGNGVAFGSNTSVGIALLTSGWGPTTANINGWLVVEMET